MSFGTLYTSDGNARSTAIRAVAKANNLDIDVVQTNHAQGVPKEYYEVNALGKIPSFRAPDGYTLTECIAIAIYFTSQNEKTSLLGKTKQDYASILRWMSFANMEVLPHIAGWFRPLKGLSPYNKKGVEDSQKAALKAIDILEKHLLVHTFLVGERITLADLFVTSILFRGFENVFDKEWRAKYNNVSRWYETIYHQPIYSSVAPKFVFIDEGLKNVPPKTAPKKEQPKAAQKPDEAAAAAAALPAPKPKHPLEALDKPTLVLDEWKRTYSNMETREEALPWFWQNFKPEEYSLWRVDYKYNDELTLTFMSSNLIGGFFARLEASRKYLFGAASVFGKSNDSVIQGVFLVRGQEAVAAFNVAPDYESYEFTKLDPSKPEDKEYVNDQWAWDKPVVVKGKEYEWADGKVFK